MRRVGSAQTGSVCSGLRKQRLRPVVFILATLGFLTGCAVKPQDLSCSTSTAAIAAHGTDPCRIAPPPAAEPSSTAATTEAEPAGTVARYFTLAPQKEPNGIATDPLALLMKT